MTSNSEATNPKPQQIQINNNKITVNIYSGKLKKSTLNKQNQKHNSNTTANLNKDQQNKK